MPLTLCHPLGEREVLLEKTRITGAVKQEGGDLRRAAESSQSMIAQGGSRQCFNRHLAHVSADQRVVRRKVSIAYADGLSSEPQREMLDAIELIRGNLHRARER